MAEFDTVVNLGLEVDDGDLRSARRAIESGLGDVSVGAGGGAAARATDGGTAGGGRRQRRMFRWARERTGHLEDVVALLGDIEENIGGGGGSGGGGLLSAIGGISILSRLGGVAGGTIGAGAVMSAITWPTITSSAVIGATFSGVTITASAILAAITFQQIAAGDLVGAMVSGTITGAAMAALVFGGISITTGAVIGAVFAGLSIGVGDVLSAVFPNVNPSEGDVLGAIFGALSITAAGVLTAVFGISMTPALVLGAVFGGVVITAAAVMDFLFSPQGEGDPATTPLAPKSTVASASAGAGPNIDLPQATPQEKADFQTLEERGLTDTQTGGTITVEQGNITVESQADPQQMQDDILAEVEDMQDQQRRDLERALRQGRTP